MSDPDQGQKSPTTPMLMPDFGHGIAIEAGRQALDRWAHGMFECSRELSAFAMTRWQDDLETMKALANCTALDQLVQCQCTFMEKALSDYMNEAGKLVGVMMEAASASLRVGQSRPAAPAQKGQAWNVAPSPAPHATPPLAPASARSNAAAHAPKERD